MDVLQQPILYSPSNNSMWFSVDPTDSYSGLTNFYIQFEIKNGDTNEILSKNNIKVYNNIYSGYGIYDAHNIIKSYLDYDKKPLNKTIGFYASENSILKYKMTISEYTGSTLLSTYVNNYYSFLAVHNLYDPKEFDYLDYMYVNIKKSKFLTDWIGDIYVRETDTYSLKFLQNFMYSPSYMKISILNNNNEIVNYYKKSPTFTSDTKNILIYCGCGPYELENGLYSSDSITGETLTNLISSNSAISYSISLYTSNGTNIFETKNFIIDRGCIDNKSYQLLWLNEKGGFDGYNFTKESHEYLNITKNIFNKNIYSQVDGLIVNSQEERNQKILNLNINEEITVSSDWLDENMSRNISNIFLSREVFLITEDEIIPIIINNEKVEILTNNNDLVQYNFTFNKSKNKNLI